MKQLEKSIGYHFRDKNLLKTAVTHSSYANENRSGNTYNERLEFLGDAVLQLITSEKLFCENPDMPEGRMSKQRAAVVCEDALAGYAAEIGLGDYMLLGKGEELSGGRHRPSILADAFEAVTGAIFLDGGMNNAKRFVLRFVDAAHLSLQDYKTLLQELVQRTPGRTITYRLVKETGPDHCRVFVMEVSVNGQPVGQGEGRSKKEAEQAAAASALKALS